MPSGCVLRMRVSCQFPVYLGMAEGNSLWRWESFFEEVESFIVSAEKRYEHANEQYAQFVVERMQTVIRSIREIRDHLHSTDITLTLSETHVVRQYVSYLDELVQNCRIIAHTWERYVDELLRGDHANSYRAAGIRTGRRGRPPFSITREQLEYLQSMSFTWSEIGSILGVSRMTIYRRRQEYTMLGERRDTLTDIELRSLLRDWRREMPEIGQSMVIGRLHSMGFHVQRERVRVAIRTVDPLNTALRAPGALTRRQPYSVPGPNSLWHIGE